MLTNFASIALKYRKPLVVGAGCIVGAGVGWAVFKLVEPVIDRAVYSVDYEIVPFEAESVRAQILDKAVQQVYEEEYRGHPGDEAPAGLLETGGEAYHGRHPKEKKTRTERRLEQGDTVNIPAIGSKKARPKVSAVTPKADEAENWEDDEDE